MEFIPFEKLNSELKARLRNTELYTDVSYSYLKIVQHGLSYSMLDSRNKLLKTYFRFPLFIQVLIYRLKALLKPSKSTALPERKILLFDEGRHFETESGEVVSMYFDRIKRFFGSEKCTHIALGGDKRISFDLRFHTVPEVNAPLDAKEKEILSSVNGVIMRLKKSGEFSTSEMEYIESAFHVFFSSFRRNYQLLKGNKAEKAFFCVHYHKEGLIAALKVLGIEAIEVQHGLISRNDFYYVYDGMFKPIAKKAFFPDKILLYGSYWKDVLSSGAEWESDQLIVAGNYLANARTESVMVTKENILFIGAQKNLAKAYVDYCFSLQKIIDENNYPWRIVVKMHPLEKTPDVYKNNLPGKGIEVLGNESNLFTWLAKSRVQISIYSTTFFDALGFDVVNFSIQDYTNSADYAREMIEEGVAYALTFDEDPIKRYHELSGREPEVLTNDQVYAKFPTEQFRSQFND